ncbi:MAG: phage integrase Arm DNA-binding domain-containing protein [Sedimenticola sp.]
MGRKRLRANTQIPNLYQKVDNRNGKKYFNYIDPRNGRMRGLGSDQQTAERVARQLNAIISEHLADQITKNIISSTAVDNSDITLSEFLLVYKRILREKLKKNKLATATYQLRLIRCKAIKLEFGRLPIVAITTAAIFKFINSYIAIGKETTAQQLRSIFVDIFDETICRGQYPADRPNPARVIKNVAVEPRRSRLSMDQLKAILEKSKETEQSWVWKSQLLALVTAQRLEDIAKMKFSDIRDGYLEVRQSKGREGKRSNVRIPLNLRHDAIGLTVGEVIELCRDKVLCPHIVHHSRHLGKAKPGHKIRAKSLSNKFAKVRNSLKFDWGKKTPASFHEIRSLAKRTYDAQGNVNTKALLGHKTDSSAAKYADPRGCDWMVVEVKST